MVVANRENLEYIVAPPGCGASMVYRDGVYQLSIPATEQASECLAYC